MDDALVHIKQKYFDAILSVLILVVMDDALVRKAVAAVRM